MRSFRSVTIHARRIPLFLDCCTVLAALLALLMLSTTASAQQPQPPQLVLADQGATDYQIVLPDPVTDPEINAGLTQTARLLQTAFKANGFEISVDNESKRDAAKPAIFLGATQFARSNNINPDQLAGWTYVIKAFDRNIVIAGHDHAGPPRPGSVQWYRFGTAKGVVDFLQQFAGTRFLYPEQIGWANLGGVKNVDLLKTPTIEYLPTAKIAVPSTINVTKIPLMEADVSFPPTITFYHLATNRFPIIDTEVGDHTHHRAIPPTEEMTKTHPEYFALINGQRYTQVGGAQAQYCFSNPDVQEMLYQDLEKHFKLGFKHIDLGQSDGFRPCQCEKCAKLFDTGNDWSEKLWILHRNLAERAYKNWPDRVVVLWAYAVTETLPKTFKQFPPNVRVMAAGTNDADMAKYKDYVIPHGFSAYVYYWTPNQVPLYLPQRTPIYIEQVAKRLIDNRILAIKRDGNGGLQWGLEGPVYYTFGKMFDGVEGQNARKLVNEFISASFGKSAVPMQRFYEQIYAANELYAQYLGTRDPAWVYRDMDGRGRKMLSEPAGVLAFLYPMDVIKALETQLSLAEKTDNSPKVVMRLALVRREFNWMKDLITTVHLYNAYQVSPDAASLDRLLNAIEARRAAVDKLYTGQGLKFTVPIPGWPYTTFPPPGHTSQLLRLQFDGYQTPFKSSFLGWDVQARRQAPLLNAKRMLCGPSNGALALDSARWARIAPQVLTASDTNAPASANAATDLKTTVTAAYDDNSIYLLFDCAVPPGTSADVINKERVEAYLMPVAGSPQAYRFSAGLQPDSRTQAARGLNEDTMDLQHAAFNPLWKGEWSHVAKFDPKTNRWQAVFVIPIRNMPGSVVKENSIWYVNFRRVNPTGAANVPAYTWSTGGTSIEDPRGNGELHFYKEGRSDAGGTSSGSAQKIAREKAYKETFEVPPNWRDQIAKGPSLPLEDWRFKLDPFNQGISQNWFVPTGPLNTAEWQPILVPSFWAENEKVGDVQGNGWYRATFTVPANLAGKNIRLMFGSVDEQAWVYVNGKPVGEHSETSEKKSFMALYDAPFTIDVPAKLLKTGEPNVLFVRVHNSLLAGGIWRPVFALAQP